MNDQELKKKLSPLKTAPVPAGYWETYVEQLKSKMPRSPRSVAVDRREPRAAWGWFLPLMAGVAIGSMSYVASEKVRASKQPPPPSQILDIPVKPLTVDSADPDAQKVFKELFQLFPNRVNWISFINGKVDFSISSVAYKKNQDLIPLVVDVRRPKEDFKARFLLRAGQETVAHATWDRKTTIELKLSSDAAGQETLVAIRLNDGAHAASVEGSAVLREGEGSVVGALKWGELLTHVQLSRPAPGK